MTHTVYDCATGKTTTVALTDAEKAEFAANKTEAEKIAYVFKRREAYPAITDQLDMQYWDKKNGTTTWVDAIAKVKSDNPKP